MKKYERDDKNVSFSHSSSQLQHICVGFSLDTITQIGMTQLFKAGLAEESSDAWTLHSSLPKADIQLKWTERPNSVGFRCYQYGGFSVNALSQILWWIFSSSLDRRQSPTLT